MNTKENNTGPNEPIEFKIIEPRGGGFPNSAWFHKDDKLGAINDLEAILNTLGGQGWDVVQVIPGSGAILLRRRAR